MNAQTSRLETEHDELTPELASDIPNDEVLDAEPDETRPRSKRVFLAGTPPIPPHATATHFVLRAGVAGPQQIWVDDHGIEQYRHPIEDFTVETILERWGARSDWYVQFFELEPTGRMGARGALQRFGIRDTKRQAPAPASPSTALAPRPGGAVGEAIALAASLKALAAEDTRMQVESIRENQRGQNELFMQLIGMIAQGTQQQGVYAQIAGALNGLAQEVARIKERLDEPDDDPEEVDEMKERAKRIARIAKKDGFGAAMSEVIAERAFELLPQIEHHVPGILAWLKNASQQPRAPVQAAPPAPAPPAAPPNGPIQIR